MVSLTSLCIKWLSSHSPSLLSKVCSLALQIGTKNLSALVSALHPILCSSTTMRPDIKELASYNTSVRRSLRLKFPIAIDNSDMPSHRDETLQMPGPRRAYRDRSHTGKSGLGPGPRPGAALTMTVGPAGGSVVTVTSAVPPPCRAAASLSPPDGPRPARAGSESWPGFWGRGRCGRSLALSRLSLD